MKSLLKLTGLSLFLSSIILYSCKKEEVPTLTTSEISNVTGTTAESGGTITDEGSGRVIAKGICWSTNISPTIMDSLTNDVCKSIFYQ
jgi:hypothetical protein